MTMTTTSPLTDLDAEMRRALTALDHEALRRLFIEQGEFLLVEDLLPPTILTGVLEHLPDLEPLIHRNFVPRVKKGGSVGRHVLDRACPLIPDLYHSPALRSFLQELTGDALLNCPASDPHTYALYYYTEPGDYIGWHYDTSYYRGKRYTLLFGLVNDSTAILDCQLHRTRSDRDTVDLSVPLRPGTMVFFNGDTVWHQVTPLGEHQRRVSLTMEFVTDPRMTPWHRFVSHMKDSIAYFGFRQVFRGRKRIA